MSGGKQSSTGHVWRRHATLVLRGRVGAVEERLSTKLKAQSGSQKLVEFALQVKTVSEIWSKPLWDLTWFT